MIKLDRKIKQSKIDPITLVRWWQEGEEEIRLSHPHESVEVWTKLIERYVEARIRKFYANLPDEPYPENYQIVKWYQEELIRLREENPNRPLKERERIASDIVERKINQYRRQTRLDEFI